MSRRLAELRHVASVLLEAELASLREAGDRRAATLARLQALDAAAARQHATTQAELEAPVAGRVLDRWGGWAERRRVALNTALAGETAAVEAQRSQAMKAFGREQALARIAAKAAAEARRKARRNG